MKAWQRESQSPVAERGDRVRAGWQGLVLLLVVFGLAGFVVSRVTNGPGDSDASPALATQLVDTDADGLPDEFERNGWLAQSGQTVKTDPLRADTDGDGLGDADEADLGSDPLSSDTDGDGLSDGQEVNELGTDPGLVDTDEDSFEDDFETEHREDRGLDPLLADAKVSKVAYARDFAIGLVAGDAWERDSLAWLSGSLASGASSIIPVVGWAVGALADARDAIALAIQGDWVGSGFSALGVIPYAGDAAAVPAKAAKFVARHPELAAAATASVLAIRELPSRFKVAASRKIWGENWTSLQEVGAGERTLLKLARGRLDLAKLAAVVTGPGHVAAKSRAKFFPDGYAGERYLESFVAKTSSSVSTQAVARTGQCVDVCNTSWRRFDVLADGVAHESKVGYTRLTERIERQIRSDAFLIKSGEIESAHWHFFASDITNQMGPQQQVVDLLNQVGIGFTVHFP